MKVLPENKVPMAKGWVLHDCHAEGTLQKNLSNMSGRARTQAPCFHRDVAIASKPCLVGSSSRYLPGRQN